MLAAAGAWHLGKEAESAARQATTPASSSSRRLWMARQCAGPTPRRPCGAPAWRVNLRSSPSPVVVPCSSGAGSSQPWRERRRRRRRAPLLAARSELVCGPAQCIGSLLADPGNSGSESEADR
nr:unnamed protein product [Digitaria exilis]